MNIPNFLTLFRIILVPAFVIFLIQEEYDKALIVFVVAGLTDASLLVWHRRLVG